MSQSTKKIILDDEKKIDVIAHKFINSLPVEYDLTLILKSYEYAKYYHRNQKRKSGDLYITHPLEVAKLAYKFGLDTDSICAAFLHDTVEDTEVSSKDIKKEFNEEISIIVEGLTKLDNSRLHLKTDIEKNINELRRMLLSASKDIRILIIKLCDRLHNMRTLSYKKRETILRISKETLFVYAPIAQKIGIYELKWELEDLSFKYLQPKDFSLIKQKLKLKRTTREEIAYKAVVEIKNFLASQGITDINMLGRPKSMYSIYRKISKKKVPFEHIYDLYAIRIITKNIGDCYHIQSLLKTHFKTYPNREKDYILNPKENWYQALHLVVYSNAISLPIEIQIRDTEMHKHAEFGVAAHWRYKQVKQDELFDKKVSWLRELLQWEQENSETYNVMHALKYDLFDSEIFVFTPKHDIIALPQGSTVLDFAYYIHTEIGNSAVKAKINGIFTNLDKVVSNSDIVEIITNPKSKPNKNFLTIAKTSKAKTIIRNTLGLKFTKKSAQESSTLFSEKITFIEGLDGYSKIRNPKCCDFELRDSIVGVETTTKSEIVIHNANCKNALHTLHRKFKLVWSQELFTTTKLGISFSKNSGVLIDLLTIFKKYNVTPLKVRNRIYKDGTVYTTVHIPKTQTLSDIKENINAIKGVSNLKELKDTN